MKRKKVYAGFVTMIVMLMMSAVCAFAEEPKSEGVYYIQSAMNENFVMDAYRADVTNETNIQLYPKNGNANQRFLITNVGGGWYKIVNMNSNLVLDVYGNQDASANLQLYTYTGNDNQLFKFEPAGDDYYYIKNKKGCYVDVYGATCVAETNIQTYPLNKQKNQKWKFVSAPNDSYMAVPEGTYTIHSKIDYNLVLDTTGASTVNETPIEIWDCNNGNNQIYKIQNNGSYYQILDSNSGKAIDVYGNNAVNCAKIEIFDPHGGDAQKFRFCSTNTGDGTFYIEHCSGLVLDITGGGKDRGTPVILYTRHGDANQLWSLSKSTPSQPADAKSSSDKKQITVFSQADSRWAKVAYGKGSGGQAATLSSSGCGILSYVNAVYYLNGQFISPSTLASWSVSHGYRINGVGTAFGLYKAFADSNGSTYGFKYDGAVGSVKNARTHLQNGGVAIISVPGHLMAMVDYDSSSGKYLILDSAKSSARGTTSGYRWLTEAQFTGKLAVNQVMLLSGR